MRYSRSNPRRAAAALASSCFVLLAAVSCQSAGPSQDDAGGGPGASQGDLDFGPISTPVVLDASYAIQHAYKSDVRVNGVAAGDVDPDVPGDEIVAVDRVGRVHLIRRDGDGFESEMIAASGGELVQVAVGDLLSSSPGDEIVAVGVETGTEDDPVPGVVRVFFRGSRGEWQESTYVTPGLVHAITIDGLGGGGSGSFVCAGFFEQALIGAFQTNDDGAVGLRINALDMPGVGNAKGVALTEAGFAFVCDDGNLVEFTRSADGYTSSAPRQRRASLARVDYAPDMGFLICDNDGFLQLVRYGENGGAHTSTLDRSKLRLRGAVLVDIDPTNQGLEACSAGYDGRIRVVRLNRVERRMIEEPGKPVVQGWSSEMRYVARDTAKLHHLASGDIDGLGTCLITCGYSGDVLLVHWQ